MRWAGALLAVVLASASCSAPTRDRVLGVLFDDPPGGGAARGAAVADSSTPPPPETSDAPGLAASAAPVTFFDHPPYADRDCESCHALGGSFTFGGDVDPDEDAFVTRSGVALLLPPEKLCFECHDEPEGESIHAPAEGGECLECHDPHRSRAAGLLRGGGPVEALCWACHDEDEFAEGAGHAGLTGTARVCTLCHDPHASGEELLLKGDRPRPGAAAGADVDADDGEAGA